MTTTQQLGVGAGDGAVVVGLRNVRTQEVHIVDGNGSARRWVVGSKRDADIMVSDPFVSKVHCVLERKPNGALIVRDAKSRNGTFIDGNSIECGELRIGAFLAVGDTRLLAVAAPSANRRHALELIRGRDPALRSAVDRAITAARVDCSALVLGETGTGKDLLARVIHERSRASSGPFIAVNCGSIARELVASELFGHERGAFTGATDTRDGWFVQADGGTLFLDEIGELPLELQPHLLRVLETKRVRRVGGTSERRVDVRIVAATHRVEGLGTSASPLRPDLYHRLATVVLTLPPLRDRMSDLGELVESMMADLAPEFGARTISDAGWDVLARHHWPGNVRELAQAVRRAVAMGGQELGPLDFFPDLALHAYRRHAPGPPSAQPLVAHDGPGFGDLSRYHRELRGAMEQSLGVHGTIRAAADAIGMPKSTFADKARAWGLVPKRKIRIHSQYAKKK